MNYNSLNGNTSKFKHEIGSTLYTYSLWEDFQLLIFMRLLTVCSGNLKWSCAYNCDKLTHMWL